MLKQIMKPVLAGAALAAALMGASQEASALNSASISAAASIPFSDIGVTPAGTVLKALVVINGLGAGSDITDSTSGQFTNALQWRCTGGSNQNISSVGNNDPWFSDLIGLCPFGVTANFAKSTIDDV